MERKGQAKTVRSKWATMICLIAGLSMTVFALPSFSAEPSASVETKIIQFIKQFYPEKEDIRVKFNSFPESLKEKVKVGNIHFSKVPDVNGEGVCLVEIKGKNSKERSAYVSFKVLNKVKLFMLKDNMKQGETIRASDIMVKETYMNENAMVYPSRIEDVVGKSLKKQVAAGSIINNQLLEDSVVVQRGEIVSVVVENSKLLVRTRGRTLERGRMGDLIRVKNLTSNREVVGKVTGSGIVKVDM